MFALRPATAADYDFLYALHREVIREYVEPIWGWREEWQADYFFKKFDTRGRWVIVVDGQDGGVLVAEDRGEEVYLGLIELLPRFQGLGIGTAIIEDLKKTAALCSIPLALDVLQTNKPARRLYERLGFRVTQETEFRYHMVWMPEASKEDNS